MMEKGKVFNGKSAEGEEKKVKNKYINQRDPNNSLRRCLLYLFMEICNNQNI